MTSPALGVPGHRVALFIWVSMLLMLVLLLGVVITLGGPPRPALSPDVLLGVAVGTSVVGILLSLLLPQRITPRPGGRGEIPALTRLVVAWSFCDAVAMFPLIAFLLTRDLRLLLVFTADLGVLVAWCPTRARWEALSGVPAGGARGRMVR